MWHPNLHADRWKNLTAAQFNQLAENFEYLKDRIDMKGCLVYRTNTLAISDSTETNIEWEAELYDHGNSWSSGTVPGKRLYMPTGYKYAQFFFTMKISADTSQGIFQAKIEIRNPNSASAERYSVVQEFTANACIVNSAAPNYGVDEFSMCTPIIRVNAGDYGTALVEMVDGDTLAATNTSFAIQYIE